MSVEVCRFQVLIPEPLPVDRIDVGLPISTYDDMRSPFPLTPDEDMAGLPTGSDADVKVKLRKKWHQFRNETEVMGESKGDFLNAQVFLPNRVIKEECNIEFKLVPGKEDPAVEHPEIYPNLLYVKGAGPANAGAANDEVDDVRATSAAKRTQKRKRRETEKVMTNEDWRLHVKRTFTPDRTKDLLIALDREQKMHKTFTGETIIGQDVSTALDVIGDTCLLRLGYDEEPDIPTDSSPKDKTKKQVKKALRINIIKAAQKGTKDSNHTLRGVIRDRLLNEGGVTDEKKLAEKTTQLTSLFQSKPNNPASSHMLHMARLQVTVRFNDNAPFTAKSDIILNANSKFTKPISHSRVHHDRLCDRGRFITTIELDHELCDRDISAVIKDPWDTKVYESSPGDGGVVISGKLCTFKIRDVSMVPFNSIRPYSLYLQRNVTDCKSEEPIHLYVYEHNEERCFCQAASEKAFETRRPPSTQPPSVASAEESDIFAEELEESSSAKMPALCNQDGVFLTDEDPMLNGCIPDTDGPALRPLPRATQDGPRMVRPHPAERNSHCAPPDQRRSPSGSSSTARVRNGTTPNVDVRPDNCSWVWDVVKPLLWIFGAVIIANVLTPIYDVWSGMLSSKRLF